MIVDTRPLVVRLVVRCDAGTGDDDDRSECVRQATVFVCQGEPVAHPLQDVGWAVDGGTSHYCPEHSDW